jgi:hypothetical protein
MRRLVTAHDAGLPPPRKPGEQAPKRPIGLLAIIVLLVGSTVLCLLL